MYFEQACPEKCKKFAVRDMRDCMTEEVHIVLNEQKEKVNVFGENLY